MLKYTEINAKLVFHEILWKKNFTVYLSLQITFGFFQQVNEVVHMEIHLISLLEYIMILNPTEKQSFGNELFFKSPL